MPHLTAILLSAATLASLAAAVLTWLRLRHETSALRWSARGATILAGLIPAGLFVARAARATDGWGPLQSHLDGLLLLCAMLAAVIVHIQWTRRLRGVEHFALPLLALLLAWAVCASSWTFRPFHIETIWNFAHAIGVYVGTLAMAFAAAAGAMYLYVRKQLKSHDHAAERFRLLGRLASLESLERATIHAATVGFLLITVGLITGVVMAAGTDATSLGPGWWYAPKTLLAAVTWAVYALVMHVNFAPNFRGKRAAVLAIIGFFLLLAVFGITVSLPEGGGV